MDSSRFRLHSRSFSPQMDVSRREGGHGESEQSSVATTREDMMRRSLSERRFPQPPVTQELSSAKLHHVGLEFHEVFQLKQGCYSDLPAAKISEMMKSNSFDNAPTQTLFSVINGILDENIERKSDEIPHRVAYLLRKLVQEIERRITTQAEHIRNQNNLMKAREEKYQSRIRVLETLACGTSEETQIVMNQLQSIKSEKTKVEESKKLGEQDIVRLMKEKENCDRVISELRQDWEAKQKKYERYHRQLETKAEETRLKSEKRVQEVELLLAESKRKTKEFEAYSESKFQSWKSKEQIFLNFIGLQMKSLQDLKAASKSIKHEVIDNQRRWCEEFISFGLKLKKLTDAAENYHTILSENRRLYNEVQELKGNIRVYCRIRPFLSGENRKSATIDYIGEDGELVLVNPSKQRKDGQRMFKFNKVFGQAATQEEVFLDIQPLIRSVLDGYNVCIFAYGQTGSGKTYTMSGPDSSSKEDWGVNYRALNDLFHISTIRRDTYMYEVGVQMVEIYNEQVRDLLANEGPPKRLGIWSTSKPNGLAVPDASMLPVESLSDVLDLMKIGLANRSVSATALNDRSSRSHSVLTVHVHGEDLRTGSTLHGSLHLVDLAGSERVDRSEVTGDRLREAQHINKSLSALGDVIFALSQKNGHVPYRNSKLTQVLQSSLGGQAKTLMFVQINPDMESYSETLSTLKFAERVSGVELGAARSNKESKGVKNLTEQVASLKDTIARKDEEIEQLQLLKPVGTRAPSLNSVRHDSNSLKHSSSSPGIQSPHATTQQVHNSSGEKSMKSNKKAASDPEDYSDYSDKDGSHQSTDDLKHPKEHMGQSELTGASMGQRVAADVQLSGFRDANSEERSSEKSSGALSMGSETDSSNSSVIVSTLFPDNGKTSEISTPKRSSVRSSIPRQLTLNAQTKIARTKAKDSLKPPSSKNNITSQVRTSSAKPTKQWQ